MASAAVLPRFAQARSHLTAVRLVQQESLRVFFELDAIPVDSRVFMLPDPRRLVVDLADCQLAADLSQPVAGAGVVTGIRHGVRAERHLRIVLDLAQDVVPTYEFVKHRTGHRLVLDLGVPGVVTASGQAESAAEQQRPLRKLVIAIDAGHGGKDPGASGRRKTREKDIMLSLAKRLHQRLSKEPGVSPVLIRDSDVYIPLRGRINLARAAKADLFVSLHADAVPRKEAKGSSVYALSLNGASSETAQWLADNATRSDLFGDVALDGMSKDLKQTLIELAQNSTLESSMELGEFLLAELGDIGPLHKNTVELANFAVLKSPDIPSVLVETAFISNPGEEKKLRSSRYQDKLAKALHHGIMNYLKQRAPVGTLLAAKRSSTSG